MNWKTELRLSDLPAEQRLEITCRRCGKVRYENAGHILARQGLKQSYIDEAEKALRCVDRGCHGAVRIAQVHEGKMEGFVGGMA